MKLLAAILITAGLVLGTISATTAYVPRLDAIDPADRLTLAAAAGVRPDDSTAPLIDPAASDTPIVLTGDVLARLAAADVKRVRVKEFAFGRWDHAFHFLASAIALVAGAFLIRRSARREVAASLANERHPEESPEHALDSAIATVEKLRSDLLGLADDAERTRAIVRTLDDLGRTHLDAFVAARPLLIGRLGAGGYARLMDRFAAAERQLNRAWSAAADHVLDESMHCLGEGAERLAEARQRLRG